MAEFETPAPPPAEGVKEQEAMHDYPKAPEKNIKSNNARAKELTKENVSHAQKTIEKTLALKTNIKPLQREALANALQLIGAELYHNISTSGDITNLQLGLEEKLGHLGLKVGIRGTTDAPHAIMPGESGKGGFNEITGQIVLPGEIAIEYGRGMQGDASGIKPENRILIHTTFQNGKLVLTPFIEVKNNEAENEAGEKTVQREGTAGAEIAAKMNAGKVEITPFARATGKVENTGKIEAKMSAGTRVKLKNLSAELNVGDIGLNNQEETFNTIIASNLSPEEGLVKMEIFGKGQIDQNNPGFYIGARGTF